MLSGSAKGFHLVVSRHVNLACPKSENLLLGRWCINGDQFKPENSVNLAKAFLPTVEQQKAIKLQHEKLRTDLVEVLCLHLNRIHGTEYSIKQWQILIEGWLRVFLNIYFNRLETLRQCMRQNNIESVAFIDKDEFVLSTQNTSAFQLACNDPTWNTHFFERLWRYSGLGGDKVIWVQSNQETEFKFDFKPPKDGIFWRLLSGISRKINKTATTVVVNPYLPKWLQVAAPLYNFQFPQVWPKK